MEARDFPKGKAVRVFWHDSATTRGWKYGELTDADVGITKISSLGYVVKAGDESLAITTSLDNQTETGALDVLAIPWGAIQMVAELGSALDRETA